MIRLTALLRRTWMVRRRPRRLSRAGADPTFVAWIHTQSCVGEEFSGHSCEGRIEQSHLRHHTGLGLKEPDRKSLPMCSGLHRDWEGHRGVFAGMSNLERFAWMEPRIAGLNSRYDSR